MDTLHCAYTDVGEGTPVIMVHGIGARRQGWDRLVARLEDRFRCITYDLRGHGDSPMPSGRFGLDELVGDLERLRQRLGIDRAHVIGHSLGGMIGPAYAHRYPDHVLSLGLLSTAAFRTSEDKAKILGVVERMRSEGIAPVLDTFMTRWFTDDFVQRFPDVAEMRKQQVLMTDAEVFLNVFSIFAETEMESWLSEVAAPALVLTGALDDGCNPRLNRLIADAMPYAELVILDGLKHAILIEASDRVAELVEGFLIRHEAPRMVASLPLEADPD